MSDVKLSEEELRDLRKWAVDYVAPEWPKTTPWLLRLLDEHAAQKLALRNVKALTRRMRKSGDSENAEHLLRFCAEAGEGESPHDILRAHDARHGGGGDDE